MASLDSVHSEVERGGMIVIIDVSLIWYNCNWLRTMCSLADPKSLERSDTLSMLIVSLCLLKEVVVVIPRVRFISGVGKHVHEHKSEGAFRMQTEDRYDQVD